jgi:hypothetical protein
MRLLEAEIIAACAQQKPCPIKSHLYVGKIDRLVTLRAIPSGYRPEELCARNGVELVWRFGNAAYVEVGAKPICFRVGTKREVGTTLHDNFVCLLCQREMREMREMERALDVYEKGRRRMQGQIRRLPRNYRKIRAR